MTELTALMSGNITFFQERCVKNRNGNMKCDDCVQACPSAAIKLINEEIFFDEQNCKGCGACRAVCPSEAFTVKSFSFLKEFSSLQSEEIILGCTLNDANRSDFNVNCYALLTEGELLYLLANKKRLIFKILHCRRCSFSSCYQDFKNCLNRVQDMLKADNRIVLTDMDSPNHGLNRRAFLQWFRDKTITALANVLPLEEKESTSCLPKRRQSLLQGFKYLADDLTEKTFIRKVNILSSCSGCGGCIKVCPNKAYQGDDMKLFWKAQRCMNCGLCIATCPERALQFEDFLSPEELLKEIWSIEFKGNRCSKCGACFFGEGETCPACSTKAKQLERNFDLHSVKYLAGY